jgi:hypothetical protein
MTTSAEAAFREVSSMLDACKKERDSMPAVLVAESIGFRRDKNSDPQVIVSLVFEDDAGSSVTLTERRHDPSDRFRTCPTFIACAWFCMWVTILRCGARRVPGSARRWMILQA